MWKNFAFGLAFVLIVGFSYWLGGYSPHSTPPAVASAAGLPSRPSVVARPTPVASGAASKKGMTWGVDADTETPDGVAYVSCHGEPATEHGSCDAYVGDTSCTIPLPLLCLQVDDTPEPPGLLAPAVNAALPDDFYAGWAGGRVATTAPMRGTELKSREIANQICASAFGDTWRLAEFHDGGRNKRARELIVTDPDGTVRTVTATGSWAFYAAGNPNRSSRFWVAIDDQPANCWD